MKRLLLMGFTLFLLLVPVGCGQYNETVGITESNPIDAPKDINNENELAICDTPTTLEFSSVDELLDSYRAMKTGEMKKELANIANEVGFSALERLYLPTSIPDEYQLYRILINKLEVSFWYMHKDDLASEKAIMNAKSMQGYFLFSFTRWDIDSPENGRFQRDDPDLVDGKYWINEPNSITWPTDTGRDIFYMRTPFPSQGYQRPAQDANSEK
jgi:hypothetical protein